MPEVPRGFNYIHSHFDTRSWTQHGKKM